MSSRSRCVPALALTLLLLLVPPVSAQQGPLSVGLSPDTVETYVNTNGSTSIRVENAGLTVMTVALSAANTTGDVGILISPAQVTVLPGSSATAMATVQGGTLVGNWSATIVAQQESALGTNGTARATALLRVRVMPANGTANATSTTNTTGTTDTTNSTGDPPSPAQNDTSPSPPPPNATRDSPADDVPPAPPRANVTHLTLAAHRGEQEGFSITVENPAAAAQRVDVVLRLPLGWGGALEATSLQLAANDRATLSGSVVPYAQAQDDEGTLELRGPGGTEIVRLLLLVEPPPDEPPLHVTSNGMRGAAPSEAAVPAPSPAPPPVGRVHVRVEPADVSVAPGTSVVLTLHVVNLGAQPIEGFATLAAEGLPLEIVDPRYLAAAGEESLLTFIARVPADAPIGRAYEGLATAADQRAAFVVRADAVVLSQQNVATEGGGAPLWLALAAGGVAAGALGLAALQRRWPLLGLAPLYARLAPRRALEHPRRQAMVELLRAEPGITLADAQRRLGLSNGVARHHVQLLVAAGLARIVQDGALRRLYPSEAPRAPSTPPLRDRALGALRTRGPMRASELAAELGVSRQALHYHLKRLEREGRIVAQRDGAELVLQPAAS